MMAGMSPKNKVKRVMLCGPSRDSVSGVATHLNQIFGSALARKYSLVQFQVGSEGRGEGAVGKLIRLLTSPFVLFVSVLRHRPDIVHLNSSLEPKAYWRDLAYLLAAKALGCKVVYQVHGGAPPHLFLGHNILTQSFLRWSLNLPDVLVLLAEVEREAYRLFNAGKCVRVIPNAISLGEYATVEQKDYKRRPVRLGYIGRLADDKGVKEVIQAVAILRQRGFDYLRLYIAGSGPYEEELRQMVWDFELGTVIEFVGPVFGEDKIRFWREIGVFVFPTFHKEGLPYTVLEAMASGTPVIATKVGGIPDVITHGVQGLLIESHDPQSVANAIGELLSDDQRLHSMSEAAIRRAHAKYGVERLSQEFDRLYQEVLA